MPARSGLGRISGLASGSLGGEARQPLVLPPNFRDVTAEKVGTVVVIVGATAAGKETKPG